MNRYFRTGTQPWPTRVAAVGLGVCLVLAGAMAAQADEHADEHADAHAKEGHLALSAEQIRHAGIEIEQVGPAPLRELLPLFGQIVPNADREQHVTARFPGQILQVYKQAGEPVARGEVLATVESNESLKSYPVVAALSGIVAQRQANAGEQTGDSTLFVIGDYSTVWVNLSVFPGDLPRLQLGQQVAISAAGVDTPGIGRIIAISPVSNSANQATTATVLLDNAQRRWVPGQFVNAAVVLSQGEIPLAVKSGAIQRVEDSDVVFVESADGFEARAVQLGRDDGVVSEVLEGLRAGESYVAGNSFVLKSELGKEGAEHGH